MKLCMAVIVYCYITEGNASALNFGVFCSRRDQLICLKISSALKFANLRIHVKFVDIYIHGLVNANDVVFAFDLILTFGHGTAKC